MRAGAVAGSCPRTGSSFELIQIHGSVYIKGSSAFYRHVAGPAAAQLLQGSWLKAPASSGSLASLASLTDLHQLLDTTLAGHGALVKGASTTVDGQKVLGLTDTSTGGTLYVATTGPPYPIAVTKGGAGGGADRLRPLEPAGVDHAAGERDRHHPAPVRALAAASGASASLDHVSTATRRAQERSLREPIAG